MTASLDRAAFLARRKSGIGGSDAAAVLGKSIYRTPMQVWEEKTGRFSPPDDDNYHLRRGRVQEPVARGRFAEKYPGLTIIPPDTQRVHRDYPWMIGNLDGLVGIAEDATTRVLEIKCPSLGVFRGLAKDKALKDDWIYQMQHYLEIDNADLGIYVVYCAEMDELLDFPIERDRILCEELIEGERTFWNEYVLKDVAPPEDTDIKERAAAAGGIVLRRDPEFVEAARQLREARELVKNAEELEESAKLEVQRLMGGLGTAQLPDGHRIAWTPTKGRASFDKKKLAAAKPLDNKEVCEYVAELLMASKYLGGTIDTAEALATAQKDMEGYVLDLSKFETVGEGSSQFRPTF